MTSLSEQIDQLLQAERTALRAGDLETLGALAADKAGLTAALESAGPQDQAELAALRVDLLEHAELMQAAQRGVVDVLERLKAQRHARTQLRTYDKDGRDTQIGQAPPMTEKRV